MTRELFDSPALPLLLRLAAEGYEFEPHATMLRVRPLERVTPELRAELTQYKAELLLLLRCCDQGVWARRDVMRAQFEAAADGRLPALAFRLDVAYVKGRCLSCNDDLEHFRFGRCWRCALAWRLAADVPLAADLGRALDTARVT